MKEKLYQQGNQILRFDQTCKHLYFVVNGKVDLEIMDKSGNIHWLESLQQGDIIGQYTVLYGQDLVFRIVAKSNTVRLLTLSSEFFQEYGDKDIIDGLNAAIKRAQEFIDIYGIPNCDFKIYRNQIENFEPDNEGDTYMKVSLQRGCRRFKLLMKLNPYSFNFFQLLIHNSLNKA